jgi:hypothetical protein
MAVLPRMSSLDCPAQLSCPAFLPCHFSGRSVLFVLSKLTCPNSPVLTILPRLFCPGCLATVVLFLFSGPDCPVPDILSLLSCSVHLLSEPFQTNPSRLSCRAVLSRLSGPCFPVKTVLPKLSCFGYPAQLCCLVMFAPFSPLCSVKAELFRPNLSRLTCPSCLSCPG